MRNHSMTLEQAYRYVLLHVSPSVMIDGIARVEKAKKLEKFQFCAWNRYDAMSAFIEDHGAGIVESLDGGITYRKV